MKLKQYLAIIAFKTKAELKAERQRTYLGFIWWILEPLMFMGIFYLVFSQMRKDSGGGYVQTLLVGLIMWQWFKSSISVSSSVILYQINLLRQVKIPAWLFPVIKVSANTVKFFLMLVILLTFLSLTGFMPTANTLYLIEIIAIQFLLIIGAVLCLASIVPFLPDIRVIVDNLLLGVFFLSGIFFPIKDIPQPIQGYLYMNPMAKIIYNAREVLLYDNPPNQQDMLYVFVIGLVLLLIGLKLFSHFQNKYAKLSEG